MPYCTQCGTSFEISSGLNEVLCRACTNTPPPRSSPSNFEAAQSMSAQPRRDDFDVYYKWLGIPPARQPPHHYCLLGLAEFEENIDVISNAYDQRVRHVRTFQLGPHSALSQLLLNELTKARLCLVNPATKAEYDQHLQRGMQQPTRIAEPPNTTPAFIPAPAVLPLASFAGPELPAQPSPLLVTDSNTLQAATSVASKPRGRAMSRRASRVNSKSNNPTREVIKIVVGGIAGCAIGWFIVYVYLPKLRERQRELNPPAVANRPVPKPTHSSPPRRKTAKSPRVEPEVPQLQPVPPRTQPTAPTIPSPSPRSLQPPIAPPKSTSPVLTPPPAPAARLSDLPKHLTLPPVSTTETVMVASTSLPDDVDVGLTSQHVTFDAAYSFVAKNDDVPQGRIWDIYLQKSIDPGPEERATKERSPQQRLVAYLTLADKRIAFRWTDDASQIMGGQLRNCFMQLTAGDDSHELALRAPERLHNVQLPPEADKFQATYNLDDLPKPETLRMDVEVTYQGNKVLPKSGTATVPRGKRLDYSVDAATGVELQVSMFVKDTLLTVRASPELQLLTKRTLTLSEDEVDDYEKTLRIAYGKAENEIAKAERELAAARNELSRATSSAQSVVASAKITNKIKAVAIAKQRYDEIEQASTYLPQIRDLVTSLRNDITLVYRIYAEEVSSQLVLVDGT